MRAGADLQGDRQVDGGDHGLEDARHQRLVFQQRGTRQGVAHLLRRAAHVDVDDVGAEAGVVARRLRQHRGIGARDLHRDRAGLAAVVQAQARLARLAQLGPRRHHLGDGQRRAEPARQPAEGAVGDAGHGSNEQPVAQRVGADLHREGLSF